MMKRLLRQPAAQAAMAHVLGRYLAFALATTRWSLVGAEHVAPYLTPGHPAVFAFWHECLPLMPALWTLARRRPEGAALRGCVLVSRHADGRFIGTLMRGFGVEVVHGSTSRGGASGLRSMLDGLRRGAHAIITPDGPRGPRRQAASGVASLAALAGVPVLPCAAGTSRRRVLRSWDRMIVPLPWGRGRIVCRPPIFVPREAASAAVERIARALSEAADIAERPAAP